MAKALAYLPSAGSGGVGSAPAGGQGPFRKFLKAENLGSVVGRTGAGLTTIGGGDQMAHAVNHYGKGGLPLLGGGDAFPTQKTETVE